MVHPQDTGLRAFVSHSHADADFCRAFVQGLRAHGVDVWYDEHNLDSGAMRHAIERELESREHFIVILSPASVASDWVNAEIDGALDLLREQRLRTFLPVVGSKCSVPLLLRRYKRLEAEDGAALAVDEAVARALRALGGQDVAVRPVMPHTRFPARLETLGYRALVVDGTEVIVPPVCDVAAGSFLLGTAQGTTNATADEQPQHSVTLAAYTIARYPVTVAEYACYVRAKGKPPANWDTQLRALDHPVTDVSLKEAMNYGRWLAKVLGQPWRLPTEPEWERAAAWDASAGEARAYPWGDEFDASRCNCRRGLRGATSSVGSHPGGASPCGAHDMAGNVLEWTRSLFRPYPYRADDGREAVRAEGVRVLRGGSWASSPAGVRCAFRDFREPDAIDGSIGFRLVCDRRGK